MENTAAGRRAEWDKLNADGGAAAFETLCKMAWAVKRKASAKGYSVGNWITTADDAQSIAGEAWTRVPAALDKAEERGEAVELGGVLFRATWAAVQYIDRAEHRNPDAATWATDENGDEYAIIDTAASATAQRFTAPEEAAIMADEIRRTAKTPEDRFIIDCLGRGYRFEDIAKFTGLTKSSVQRRVNAIRARRGA